MLPLSYRHSLEVKKLGGSCPHLTSLLGGVAGGCFTVLQKWNRGQGQGQGQAGRRLSQEAPRHCWSSQVSLVLVACTLAEERVAGLGGRPQIKSHTPYHSKGSRR